MSDQSTAPVIIDRLDAHVFRAPTPRPVSTSFGVMTDRPAVFVRVTDKTGAFGWGEIFANWPAAGAEHRARLLMEDISDLVLGVRVEKPSDLFYRLEKATHTRALQCGEWGPFRQVIAGLDIALHDLFARQSGKSMRCFLNPEARTSVPAYASGIHVRDGAATIPEQRTAGHQNFKVKIGFDRTEDLNGLRSSAATLLPGEKLLSDANQAWTLPEAIEFVHDAADIGLGWLEEAIGADAPAEDWRKLAEASSIPLSGGENIAGFGDFDATISAGSLSVIQPDIMKWGGFTGCVKVSEQAIRAGRLLCPHFLGGGIGLVASAHMLAAVGGNGMLEVDANINPLRDDFTAAGGRIRDGEFHIHDGPGLGIDTLPESLEPLRTLSLTRHQ